MYHVLPGPIERCWLLRRIYQLDYPHSLNAAVYVLINCGIHHCWVLDWIPLGDVSFSYTAEVGLHDSGASTRSPRVAVAWEELVVNIGVPDSQRHTTKDEHRKKHCVEEQVRKLHEDLQGFHWKRLLFLFSHFIVLVSVVFLHLAFELEEVNEVEGVEYHHEHRKK